MMLPSSAIVGLLLAWLAAMGGTIGSFLNVVVYRLPAGMSLSYPGSRCPACKHPIRWYDNMPVLGWLMLGGHCRDCDAPISPRYPLVEGVTGAMFVALALAECFSRTSSLPLRPAAFPAGATPFPLTLHAGAGIYAYHLFLLCTLLPAALIQHDGRRVPWRLASPALIVGLVAPLMWPHLHPVPAVQPVAGSLAGLIDSVTGLGAGLVIAAISAALTDSERRPAAVMAPALVGLFLGWQAVAVLGSGCLAVFGLGWLWRRFRPGLPQVSFSACWPPATLAWLLVWRPLVERLPWLAGG